MLAALKKRVQYGDTYRDVRVTGTALGVSGGEDGVDEHKGSDDLSTKSSALAVPQGNGVGPTSLRVVVVLHEGLHQPNSTDRTQALRYHVRHRPDQRNLPSQKQPERHRRIYVTTCTKMKQMKLIYILHK